METHSPKKQVFYFSRLCTKNKSELTTKLHSIQYSSSNLTGGFSVQTYLPSRATGSFLRPLSGHVDDPVLRRERDPDSVDVDAERLRLTQDKRVLHQALVVLRGSDFSPEVGMVPPPLLILRWNLFPLGMLGGLLGLRLRLRRRHHHRFKRGGGTKQRVRISWDGRRKNV